MTARAPVKWTPAARARVLALYGDATHSGSTIAAVIRSEFGLAVTASSVIGVAYRGAVAGTRPPALSYEEGLRRHRDQRRVKRAAARAARPAPTPKPPKPAKVPPVARVIPLPRPVPVARPAAPAPAVILPSLMIPLLDAGAGNCRYIADDPRAGPATVCGHPSMSGSSWCAGHHRICTVPVRPVFVAGFRRAA